MSHMTTTSQVTPLCALCAEIRALLVSSISDVSLTRRVPQQQEHDGFAVHTTSRCARSALREDGILWPHVRIRVRRCGTQ